MKEKQNSVSQTLRNVTGLFFWLFLCFLVAWMGAQVSPGIGSAEWYESINKPAWNPPAWLFAPVWTTLYTMMGIAAWLIWRNYGYEGARMELIFFLVQLVLNGAWSWIFFGTQSPGWAFIEIILLLTLIGITTRYFWEKHKLAGGLMIPYLLWVAFATVLNGTIWWIN